MMRIEDKVTRGAPVHIHVDGQPVSACAGETVATALLATGVDCFYRTPHGTPRMPFCNMGSCFECRVQVRIGERESWQLACMIPVAEGMQIRTGVTAGDALAGAFHDG